MGSGIAQVAAANGFDVALFDVDDGAAEKGHSSIRNRLVARVERGKLTQDEADRALERVSIAHSIEEVGQAASVIEAVVEKLEVKQGIFRQLAEVADEDSLLATNTSALPVTDIAATSLRPTQIIGMHFFSPVPAMALCEIVRGYRTTDSTLAKAQNLANALGKETITVTRDDAGFVTSRIMAILVRESALIVESGLATAEDVDRACRLGFGHSMGPLETADLTGVDVAYNAGESVYQTTKDPSYRSPQLLRRMVSAGALGRKTDEGFYTYQDGEEND
ncbi:3-hydroxyacyl-CoA dehydrogenase family protein [Ancrocorticia sp.]|uniref:3-hydroxyacyl-CoA dehydrogenase family protein n=1 Tax=Ancrocorticia sp. TaxID=2593684 RepID=UPI003F934DC8